MAKGSHNVLAMSRFLPYNAIKRDALRQNPMLLIKRYPNRKLYDTAAKKYITLEGIAELIRTGKEIQVLDHTSSEDLTAVVLTQIIFEQEKKSGGFLPRSVLRGLVQAGGDTLGSLRRTLASPLELFHHVDDEIRRRIDGLIKRGEMSAETGEDVLTKLLDQGKQAFTEAASLRTDELSQRLAELGVPTRNEIEDLTAQLESLEAALDRIAEKRGSD